MRPVVSVIIPARNEEANLRACLDSIVNQAGVAFEVIVADDNSTDGTARIAASYPTVKVIEPGPLPAGWSGKSHAISKAVVNARGDWFLFTDADTIHGSNSVAMGMNEAVEQGADLLSYSPYQITGTLWEKLIQPSVYAELNSRFNYNDVNNPHSEIAAANGQYILIRREIYDTVGGHEAIKNDLLEDVALARAVKASGGRLRFRYAPDAISTRMYRNLRQLWEGWSKNLALLFEAPVKMAIVRFTEFVLFIGGIIAAMDALLNHSVVTALVLIAVPVCVFFGVLKRFRHAGFGVGTTFLCIVGLPLFSALLLNAYLNTRVFRRAIWKGRTYIPTTGGN